MYGTITLRDTEFERFRRFLYEVAGVSMTPQKKSLVASRLSKRVSHYGLSSYGEYFELATSPNHPGELQVLLDLLTTHETYFFREPKHFEFLENDVLKLYRGNNFRAWSAACSSGEEAYSIAMLLAHHLGKKPWEVVGSDVSLRMVESSQRAVYPSTRLHNLPSDYLKSYCLKGVRQQEGMIMIDRSLRERCRFTQINLMEKFPDAHGKYDVIFLRNVMIYFDLMAKKRVISSISKALNRNGYLIIGHSETLNGVSAQFKTVRPSIYQYTGL